MNWYLEPWKKYGDLSGRARRLEYWTFVLGNLLISIVLGIIDAAIGPSQDPNYSLLGTIFALVILIPTIAVGIRRMHDTEHSGWWILVPIVNLVFALTPGTKGPNRYGPDPKAGPPPA